KSRSRSNKKSMFGKRTSSKRESALGKSRSRSNKKSMFGKRTSSKRESALGKSRSRSNKKSMFGKRTSSKRESALGKSRSRSNKKSMFGKRDSSKARLARMFDRNSKSKPARHSGALGKRNRSGSRQGSMFGRTKGDSNKTRTASALGNRNGRSKNSYGNAFGRGGAGSGKTFGLPKGIRDARSLKQMNGNPIPNYPYQSRVRKNQGVVFLVYYVNQFGRVSRVKIHKSSGFFALDDSAKKTISRYRYYKGQSGYVIHPIEFTLNGTVKVKTNGKSRI
ncbi:MAG: TonB family protein, partial [Bdellovibrionales bacterium]|nr:TonB family protein [Bdellovibrionales bacterium]